MCITASAGQALAVSASAVPVAFCLVVPHSQSVAANVALVGRGEGLGASAGPGIGTKKQARYGTGTKQ